MSDIINRRMMLQAGCGFGSLALGGMLPSGVSAAAATHHAPKAKRVLFLFMQGGVGHIDSFDHKPRLTRDDGKMMPFDDSRQVANTGARGSSQRIFGSPWKFAPRGQSGKATSDLFPNIGNHVDDLCFLHGMHTEGVAHGPATLFLHCGSSAFVRPSMGSWVLYGLGTENENLPGFITISPSPGNGGSRNYGTAFLPPRYQGTPLGRAGGPSKEVTFRDLSGAEDTGRVRGLISRLNAEQQARQPKDAAIDAVVRSYETAARMQLSAPGVIDLSTETASTLANYGIGSGPTDSFGRQCLLARRFLESGVRFVQVTYGDGSANPAWDQHSNLLQHAVHARAVDQPVAALLADLKQRGLLDETLVWFGSEFGRTPYAQGNGTGRDHNPTGFTVWLAGGGVKPGFSHGATDEFGHNAVEGRMHMHDLHATILHLLGIDHERLTYRSAGREFRLTDVHGHVAREIIA